MDTLFNILGFLAGVVIGISGLVVGIMLPSAGLIAFGVWALLAVSLAWFSGAKAEPGGNPFKRELKAKFKYVPAWAWWIIFGTLILAIIIAVLEGAL
jgi:hypothetical protein